MIAINAFLESNLYPILISLSILLFISLIWNIILTIQYSMVNNRYKRFMKGTSGKNIEGMILEHLDSLKANEDKFTKVDTRLEVMQDQLDRCLQKHSIVRYNAFNDTGSDLSFSFAIMDNYDNGISYTGIYGRNEFVGYAKPIEKGGSTYPLSVEEQMAISRCQKKRVNNKA
jgi:hypothetical protein